MEKLFELYKRVLLSHIQTKTTHSQFHDKSESFYEAMFDVFHLLSEKRQDTWVDECEDDDVLIKDAYDAIEEAQSVLIKMTKETNTIGTDNLIRSLLDSIEGVCWNARAFICEEKDEEKDDMTNDIKRMLPNKLPNLPRKN